MDERAYRPGQAVLRLGADLPHLGVFAGQIYEVEEFSPQTVDGLWVKGVPAGLNPRNFRPAESRGQ